ncbi:hypothetical protein CAZ16_32650 [Pseudomonas aeruginosa]|nr:hypothetical protein PA13_1024990 [Pseudomonas aeruginosa HB13]OKS40915.1 hypothetical protein BH608_00930 [Pseudomonas aeruginosa]OPE18673.1 hypothetical protein APA92_33880 [Pseudomonas aeruginosa]OTI57764.1 hypothetical protein CAZ28_30955 [Pseudomonas aeruginosa]OTI77347.1 hypothetical protein CAZ16_32650 [Pseudomonas aeruginosa]
MTHLHMGIGHGELDLLLLTRTILLKDMLDGFVLSLEHLEFGIHLEIPAMVKAGTLQMSMDRQLWQK